MMVWRGWRLLRVIRMRWHAHAEDSQGRAKAGRPQKVRSSQSSHRLRLVAIHIRTQIGLKLVCVQLFLHKQKFSTNTDLGAGYAWQPDAEDSRSWML